MVIQFFASGAMLFGLAYFAPTIVQAIGYKGTSNQLHTVPPYACATGASIFVVYSDRLRQRGIFVIIMACISTTGYAMYLGSSKHNVLYASLFLQVIGTCTIAALQTTWMANNLAPYFKRATGITLGFITTNCGGILSTWLFPTSEAPRYHRGTSILLGLSSSIIVVSLVNTIYLKWQNQKKARALEQGAISDREGRRGDKKLEFEYFP
ncbi:MAG: hypothetical protein CYPHOPRED_003028 [Cyphobasidiales sp. Tagirdzhanova-0007]|nr:MAG: hypothetical protein CYPHOPRED_003028 [Cyphobasidiales sp. Tagirdzhanova-0007]